MRTEIKIFSRITQCGEDTEKWADRNCSRKDYYKKVVRISDAGRELYKIWEGEIDEIIPPDISFPAYKLYASTRAGQFTGYNLNLEKIENYKWDYDSLLCSQNSNMGTNNALWINFQRDKIHDDIRKIQKAQRIMDENTLFQNLLNIEADKRGYYDWWDMMEAYEGDEENWGDVETAEKSAKEAFKKIIK